MPISLAAAGMVMFWVTGPAGLAACCCMNWSIAALVLAMAAKVCWSWTSPCDIVRGWYSENRLWVGEMGAWGGGNLGKSADKPELLSANSEVYSEEEGLGNR